MSARPHTESQAEWSVPYDALRTRLMLRWAVRRVCGMHLYLLWLFPPLLSSTSHFDCYHAVAGATPVFEPYRINHLSVSVVLQVFTRPGISSIKLCCVARLVELWQRAALSGVPRRLILARSCLTRQLMTSLCNQRMIVHLTRLCHSIEQQLSKEAIVR